MELVTTASGMRIRSYQPDAKLTGLRRADQASFKRSLEYWPQPVDQPIDPLRGGD
jgi:hypothetical protein